jgi:hypothetical protein
MKCNKACHAKFIKPTFIMYRFPVGTVDCFPGVKPEGLEADYSLLSSGKVKNERVRFHFTIRLLSVVLN